MLEGRHTGDGNEKKKVDRKASCFTKVGAGSPEAFPFPFARVLRTILCFLRHPRVFRRRNFFGFPRHKSKLNCLSSAPLIREIFSRDVTARRVFEGRRSCGNHLGDDFRSFAQVLHVESFGRKQKAAIWKDSIKFAIRYVTYVMGECVGGV